MIMYSVPRSPRRVAGYVLLLQHRCLRAEQRLPCSSQGYLVGQVGEWLHDIQLGQYTAVFTNNSVNGQQLLSMQEQYLIDTLQIASKLHR
jgi:hypothetical protein